jgi:stage II sporulation protein E
MDREGFSTIDLCEIDLRSAKTEFIKIGGAQSYIKTQNNIETVLTKGIPAGIMESINTDNITRQLSDNDMIVMVSDGVSEAGYGVMRGEWVKGLMKSEGLENKELAKSIVTNARKKIYPRTPDDMSAVVITLHEAEILEEEIIA